jgi:hypothetical protein
MQTETQYHLLNVTSRRQVDLGIEGLTTWPTVEQLAKLVSDYRIDAGNRDTFELHVVTYELYQEPCRTPGAGANPLSLRRREIGREVLDQRVYRWGRQSGGRWD